MSNLIFLVVLATGASISLSSIGCFFFLKGRRCYDVQMENNGVKLFVAAFISLIACFTVFWSVNNNKLNEAIAEYEVIVNEIEENADNLIFYLDGEVVPYDNIDIRQYQISYDTTSNKVFLTQKVESTNKISSFIPIFIPRF